MSSKRSRRRVVSACGSALLAVALACPGPAALAFSVPMPGAQKGIDRREIAVSERQWRDALVSGDVAVLSSLLSDSYVGIGPDGTIFNKAEEIEASTSGADRLRRLHIEDRKIRIYGTTAVVTSRVLVQGTFNGQSLLGHYRYTRVWVLSHGQWRIVSFEANRVDDSTARKE